MKKIAVFILCFVAGLGLATIYFGYNTSRANERSDKQRMADAVAAIEHTLQDRYDRIADHLGNFSRAVSADQGFSMKLIAEQDRSAPEVSEIAVRYLDPMGFSFLSVCDSSMTMLSCGHFPAAAGNKASPVADLLDDTPAFCNEMRGGVETLTLQAKAAGAIAETPVYCIGGVAVDDSFVTELVPFDGVRLLLKQGAKVRGGEVQAIPEVSGSTIVINDTTWVVSAISLPWKGEGDIPQLLVLLRKSSNTLFSFLF